MISQRLQQAPMNTSVAFRGYPFIFLRVHLRPYQINQNRHDCASEGFTLVEVLVTAIIVAVVAAAAAISTNVAANFSNKALANTRVDAVIDQDLAALERAAFQYTYCTGSYKWDDTLCGSAAPGTQDYYFPSTTSANVVAAEAFGLSCRAGTMTDALRDAMNGGDAALALSVDAQNLGITRQITRDSEEAHRLLVTYTFRNSVKRQRPVVPAAAYWCPDTEAL